MDDEQDLDDEAAEAGESGEAEYAFEGYRVEFNARVALTPPAALGG